MHAPVPRTRRLAALATAAALIAGVLMAAPASASPPGAVDPKHPDFGPNVTVFDPSMPVAEIQATLDAPAAKQVDNEMGTDRYAFLLQAGHLRHRRPAAADQGRLLHRDRRPRRVPRRRGDQRQGRGLQPLPRRRRHQQLPRAGQLLAHAVQPLDPHQRPGQDGCRADGQLLGRLAGRVDAPVDVTAATLSLMDYCTAGPQYASGGFIADSKLPTVINGSQQQWLTRNSEVDELDQRRVEPGLLRRRRRPDEAAFPNPPYTTLATTPVSREKPYLFVDAKGKYQRPRPVGAGATPAASPGRTALTRGPHHPAERLLRRQAGRLGAEDQRRARARQEPAAHAGRLRHRPTASTCLRPTRSCSASATPRSPRSNGATPLDDRRRAGRHRRRRHHRRRRQGVAGPAAGRPHQARLKLSSKLEDQPDHAVRRVLPRRRPARRQDRRPRSRSTATTCSSTTPGCGAPTTASRASPATPQRVEHQHRPLRR